MHRPADTVKNKIPISKIIIVEIKEVQDKLPPSQNLIDPGRKLIVKTDICIANLDIPQIVPVRCIRGIDPHIQMPCDAIVAG